MKDGATQWHYSMISYRRMMLSGLDLDWICLSFYVTSVRPISNSVCHILLKLLGFLDFLGCLAFWRADLFLFVFQVVICNPQLEKHGWHVMILPWSYHYLGETWSWSSQDGGMAVVFLGMFVKIHGMFMVWLPCFPWFIPWSWSGHHVFHVFFSKKWIVCQCFLH